MLGVAPEPEIDEQVPDDPVQRRRVAALGEVVEQGQFRPDVDVGPGVIGDEEGGLVEGDLVLGTGDEIGEVAGRRHFTWAAWAMASSKLVLAARSLR